MAPVDASLSSLLKRLAALLCFGAGLISQPAAAESFVDLTPGTLPGDPTPAELRLLALGYRLAVANGDRCDAPEQITGLRFQDIAAYDAKDRAHVAKQLSLGLGFGVTSVIEGSPGDLAGLRVHDEILSINGQSISDFALGLIRSKGSYDRIEAFSAKLDASLKEGRVELVIRRGAEVFQTSLASLAGCGGSVVLYRENTLNAWSDGRAVAVTTRMMRVADDENELAFVVAHEMAHNILKHAQKLAGRSALLAEFGVGFIGFRRSEKEADALAVELLSSGNFDPSGGERLLRKFGGLNLANFSLTHPASWERVSIIRNAITKLEKERVNRIGGSSQLALEESPSRIPRSIRFGPDGTISWNADVRYNPSCEFSAERTNTALRLMTACHTSAAPKAQMYANKDGGLLVLDGHFPRLTSERACPDGYYVDRAKFSDKLTQAKFDLDFDANLINQGTILDNKLSLVVAEVSGQASD